MTAMAATKRGRSGRPGPLATPLEKNSLAERGVGEAAEQGQSGVGSGQGMVPVLTCQSKRWATLPT